MGLVWLTPTTTTQAASRRLRSTETSQEAEAMAAMTRYCFLKDHLGQLPLPVVKSRQMGGQDSSKNINGDTLELQLGLCLSLGGQMGEGKASSQIKATS